MKIRKSKISFGLLFLRVALITSLTLTLTPPAQAMQHNPPPTPPIPQEMDRGNSSTPPTNQGPPGRRFNTHNRNRNPRTHRNPIAERRRNEDNRLRLPPPPITAEATIASHTDFLNLPTARVESRPPVTAPDVTILSAENQQPGSTIPNATRVRAAPLEAIVVGSATPHQERQEVGRAYRNEQTSSTLITSESCLCGSIGTATTGLLTTLAAAVSIVACPHATLPLAYTSGGLIGATCGLTAGYHVQRRHEASNPQGYLPPPPPESP